MSLLKRLKQPEQTIKSTPEGVSVTLEQLLMLQQFTANTDARPLALSTQAHGQHQVSQRSRGIEFAELRQYWPGDDVRTIDWRQTAKRGRVYTRDYQDEHARQIRLLIDMGPGMRFATRGAFKSVVAARIAALLAWQSVAIEDLVGGMVWGVQGQQLLSPRGQHQGALALLKQVALASQTEPEQMAINHCLTSGCQNLQQGTEVIIISDFSGLTPEVEQQIKVLSRQVDVKLIHIFDSFEQNPPYGKFWVTNGSDKTELNLNSSATRQAYLEPFELRLTALKTLARQIGAPLISISTNDDIVRQLSVGMVGRDKKAGKS